MSGIKVKLTNSYNNNNNKNKIFKVKLSKNYDVENNIDINIGSIVKSKLDEITGKVISIDSNKVTILWNDGCKEKIKIFSFLNEVEILPEEIVSEMIEQVQETKNEETETENVEVQTRQIKKENKVDKVSNELDDLYENVFNEMEDDYEDIIDANPNKIKEQILNRKAYTLEKKIEQKQINNVKDKAINELIDLMKNKGLINGEHAERIEKEKLFKMNDVEFENFKDSIISADKADNELSEAEMMLQRIKFNGPIIGGFDKNQTSFNDSGTREIIQRKDREMVKEAKLNLEGFRNLEGLTKPLQVQNQQKTMKENLSSAIADLGWTTISKIY